MVSRCEFWKVPKLVSRSSGMYLYVFREKLPSSSSRHFGASRQVRSICVSKKLGL